jgi:hypothetical protein
MLMSINGRRAMNFGLPTFIFAAIALGAPLLAGASETNAAQRVGVTTTVDIVELLKARRGETNQLALRNNIRVVPRTGAEHASTVTSSENDDGEGAGRLPLWTYDVVAARDGLHHQGAMVGSNPFTHGGTSKIPTMIIPLIIRTHSIVASLDPNTFAVTTTPGIVTLNPEAVDANCLHAPNNVPTKLFAQSPVFQPAQFSFGSTPMGYTQYIDAFQRANFYEVWSKGEANYHVILDPVTTDKGILVDVPANEGIAFVDGNILGPPAFCAPYQIIDLNWLDAYISGTLLPMLKHQGIDAGSLPIFMIYNAYMDYGNFSQCCVLGYHAIGGQPVPTQTYAVSSFDLAQWSPPGYQDSSIVSHEIGEWVNDPYLFNGVPPWGYIGQVQNGCQNNLEVGDPLTGTSLPVLVMPNGFSYHLQELAFFSWFFGGTSIGAQGWYSSNGSLTVDAGPVCP